MPKGFHTQGLVILLKSPQSLDALRRCVPQFEVVKEGPAAGEVWMAGPSLIVAYRPEVNGYVSVDVVDRRWPDHMGDPKKEAMLFACWSMGHFGPFAYPGGLQRAVQQSWTWKEAGATVQKHTAFIRLRTSYIFGAGRDAKVIPPDYDSEHELQFLTSLAGALLECPAALCYFNPNGEVVLPKSIFDDSAAHHTSNELPPLNLWCNVRLFQLGGGWLMMDSVGGNQLDSIDIEVGFPQSLCTPREIDRFIRDTSLYILRKGDVIKDGDTVSGPGNVDRRGKHFEKGMSDPPRRTLRFLPCDQKGIPEILLREKEEK
ncbi:conserved hypothetical protein [Chthoniobacter flavus Ellin428]|uniref:DUF4261 domain-containing protein n=1 Tax=Chthoniobacter flavus Ellin428 TaxID=497964 RepID=B4DAN1_9BACT|nr:DUF4261 domain-containing protein [Chthoniobacter flavus]EDY16549.1 conserved hypothetical protein [Chthoniobacter flavus Ellin428]TCO82463.1 uncharacterized protein DUF4261 [Chthoniobacter flavus]